MHLQQTQTALRRQLMMTVLEIENNQLTSLPLKHQQKLLFRRRTQQLKSQLNPYQTSLIPRHQRHPPTPLQMHPQKLLQRIQSRRRAWMIHTTLQQPPDLMQRSA